MRDFVRGRSFGISHASPRWSVLFGPAFFRTQPARVVVARRRAIGAILTTPFGAKPLAEYETRAAGDARARSANMAVREGTRAEATRGRAFDEATPVRAEGSGARDELPARKYRPTRYRTRGKR
jgi:hypothetical protein